MKEILNYRAVAFSIFFLAGFSQYSHSQSLQDYLGIAAENNPGLKADYAEFEAALQEVPQVKGLPDPTLTMSAFGGMPNEEAGFSLMQMFPWFGTLEAKANVAALLAEAKYQSYLSNRNKLFYEISQTYYDLYELEKSIQFQKNNFDILQDYKELALAKVRAGSGALADVLQAELIMNETQTALEVLELQRKPLLVQFNKLLGRTENTEINVARDLDLNFSEINLSEAPEFDANPGLKVAEKKLEASRAQEIVAKKTGLPSFGIGLEYMVMSEMPGMGIMGSGEDKLMPMLSISLPVFRKKYKAARKEAQLMQESYSYRKKEVRNELSSEYASAVFNLKESLAMLKLYEKQIKSTEQILKLLISAYQNSASDFEEVLRVRQKLLEYRLALAGAESKYYSALARINYLKGI